MSTVNRSGRASASSGPYSTLVDPLDYEFEREVFVRLRELGGNIQDTALTDYAERHEERVLRLKFQARRAFVTDLVRLLCWVNIWMFITFSASSLYRAGDRQRALGNVPLGWVLTIASIIASAYVLCSLAVVIFQSLRRRKRAPRVEQAQMPKR